MTCGHRETHLPFCCSRLQTLGLQVQSQQGGPRVRSCHHCRGRSHKYDMVPLQIQACTHSKAARTIASDLIPMSNGNNIIHSWGSCSCQGYQPLMFCGFKLQTKTTILSLRASTGMCLAKPLITVRGATWVGRRGGGRRGEGRRGGGEGGEGREGREGRGGEGRGGRGGRGGEGGEGRGAEEGSGSCTHPPHQCVWPPPLTHLPLRCPPSQCTGILHQGAVGVGGGVGVGQLSYSQHSLGVTTQ